MNYWIQKGADRKKLIMGMPMYGQSFALADNKERGLNSQAYGPGEAGEFTRAGGFLAYYEVSSWKYSAAGSINQKSFIPFAFLAIFFPLKL